MKKGLVYLETSNNLTASNINFKNITCDKEGAFLFLMKGNTVVLEKVIGN